jgi:hypothetical protein
MQWATQPSLEYQMMFLFHIHQDISQKTNMDRGLIFTVFFLILANTHSRCNYYYVLRLILTFLENPKLVSAMNLVE